MARRRIGVKDTVCVDVCPVDCIHPTKNEAEAFQVGRDQNSRDMFQKSFLLILLLGLLPLPLTIRADISGALVDYYALNSFATAGAMGPFLAMWEKPAFRNPTGIRLITDGFVENAFHRLVGPVENSLAKPVHSTLRVHARLEQDFIRIDISDAS